MKRTQLHVVIACLAALLAAAVHSQPAADPPYYDPGRWEEAWRAFEDEDARDYPPRDAIVFHGSSSIYFWHERLAEDMAPLTVIPRGFGGSTMADAIHSLDRIVLPYHPRAIVLYEGDNDIGAYGEEPERVRDLFRDYAGKVHAALPDARIYLLAIKPSMLRWEQWPRMQEANRLLREDCAADARLTFIDVAAPLLNTEGMPREELYIEDRLHLDRAGYERWRDVVRPLLMERELRFEAGKD